MTTWKEYKLGEIADNVSYGYTESADEKPIGPKFLRITDIREGSINWDTVPYCPINEKDYIKNKLEIGDIVIARTGATTGITETIKQNVEAVFASYLIRFRINRIIANPFYVGFVLKSPLWKEYVSSIVSGSAQPGANAKQFSDFSLNLPPLPTQTAIAEILSSLDDKIELNNKINAALENLAQTLFKQWFIDFEYPYSPPLAGWPQDGVGIGKTYKSSGNEMIESELGMIPKGWEVKQLKEILTIKRGGSPRPIQDYISKTGLPWVKISDATALKSPFLFATKEFIRPEGLRKTILMKKGSLVLSNSATPGLPIFLELDACIHDGWLHFQNIKNLTYNYLYLFFLSIKENLIGQGNGSIFINLKTDILKDYQTSIAPHNIITGFEEIISPIFDKIKQNSLEIIELSNLRDILLPKLISGELAVTEVKTEMVN